MSRKWLEIGQKNFLGQNLVNGWEIVEKFGQQIEQKSVRATFSDKVW